jgi:tetratricopeptide (TPR) repeat protein
MLKTEAERTRVPWHRGQAAESELSGDWFAAAFHWSELIQREPSNFEFLLRRGIAYHGLGRLPESQADLSRVIELQPNAPEAWDERGQVNAEQGRWPEAVRDFAKARDLSPSHVIGWSMLGFAQLGSGDMSGHHQALREMLTRFSETDNPWIAREVAERATVVPGIWRGEAEQAKLVHLARLAKDRYPERALFVDTLGKTCYRAGLFSEAEQCLNEAVNKEGDDVGASTCFFLALTCQQLGRQDEARQWLDKAIARSEQETAWDPRVINRVLRQEAESLLTPAAKPAPDPAAKPEPPTLNAGEPPPQ